MEKQLVSLYQNLQKLAGLHRQLLDVVRLERQFIIQAHLNEIHNVTNMKQALVESVYQVESERLKLTSELAIYWKKPFYDLTLSNIIIHIQGVDPKGADQFRSTYNLLTILIQRITEQNQDNRLLIEKSLEHVHEMKKNILGEACQKSSTYTHQGQRTTNQAVSRIISQEA